MSSQLGELGQLIPWEPRQLGQKEERAHLAGCSALEACLSTDNATCKLVLGHSALQFSGLCPDCPRKETGHRLLCLFSSVTGDVFPETHADSLEGAGFLASLYPTFQSRVIPFPLLEQKNGKLLPWATGK